MKIGWLLSGNKKSPSSRIQGWNVDENLKNMGIDSKVVYAPSDINRDLPLSIKEVKDIVSQNFDILVFQKISSGRNLYKLIDLAKKSNTKIVYLTTDVVDSKMVSVSDAVIVVNSYYSEGFDSVTKSNFYEVIDSYEHDGSLAKLHNSKKDIDLVFLSSKAYPKLPWIADLPSNTKLSVIGPSYDVALNYDNLSKEDIYKWSRFDINYIVWNLKTVYANLLNADVGIIPYPPELIGVMNNKNSSRVKSTARAVLLMSLGLPIIVSPLESYTELIKHGENGFIARSAQDWIDYISLLRDNPKLRKVMGLNGRETVIKDYSNESQTSQYLAIFNNLL